MKLILHPEGITVTDLSSYSEFSNGGYDVPAVCKAVNEVLKISDDIYLDEIVKRFNRIYWKHASFIEQKIIKQSHMQYLRLSRTIEFVNDEEINEEDEALQKLVDLYNQLCTDVLNSKNIFQEMTEKKYLDAFRCMSNTKMNKNIFPAQSNR